jgi:tape measure domain-containing protein
LFAGQQQIQNVRASRTSREASGFLAFSQAAGSVTDVDRAARRKRARTILQESDELQRALQRMSAEPFDPLKAALGPKNDQQFTKSKDRLAAWTEATKTAKREATDAAKAIDKLAAATKRQAAASVKALQGRIGSAAIGGAFPLLFGQSGLAALGGLIGGAVGGAGGGFAGSLVGTLIGDLINTKNQIRELAREMGLGAEQAQLLGLAFRQAGADADKFQAAVQNVRGVGFTQEDEFNAIRLASKLADDYGGKVDKIAQGLANIATKGKSGLSDINKFTAQGVPILRQLERNLGLTRSQLLQLAKDGKISAQQTVDALVDIANAGRDSALATKDPWFDTWKSIKDSAVTAFDGIVALLAPLGRDIDNIALKISQAFAQAFRDVVEFANKAAAGILNAFASVVDNLAGGSEALSGLPLVGGAMEEDAKRLRNLAKEARDLATSLQTVREGAANESIKDVVLPGLQDTEKDTKKDGGKERKSRVPQLQEELRLAQQLAGINEKIRGAQFDEDRELQLRLQGEAQRAKIASDIAQVKLSDVPVAEKALQIAKLELDIRESLRDQTLELAELERDRQRNFQNTIDALNLELASANAITRAERDRLEIEKERLALRDNKDLTQGQKDQIIAAKKALLDAQAPLKAYRTELERSLTDTDAQIVRMAQTIETEIGSAMSSAITGVITGTQTVEQAMASMFENIGKAFIDMATQMIAKALVMQVLGIFAGGGSKMDLSGTTTANVPVSQMPAGMAFADGGYPPVGQASLVGERGPELFIPGQQGLVVPNDIFDATRQALTSGGGTDQAFSENSEALAVANSYTRERMFERERQTMLTGAGGSTTVQTQVINNVEYATIDQVQEVANLSAKKARAQVFSDMRNRPSTRASLGMA